MRVASLVAFEIMFCQQALYAASTVNIFPFSKTRVGVGDGGGGEKWRSVYLVGLSHSSALTAQTPI